MKARSVLYLTSLALVIFLAQPLGFFRPANAQTGNPNPQTGLLPDPGLPSGMTYASGRTISRYSLFGNPCCIHPEGVIQGALGDCFFMSAMDTLAMTRPGTIQKAIRYNPISDTYTITFYEPPAGQNAETTAAWVPHTYTTLADVPVQSVSYTLWNSQPPFFHPVNALNSLLNPQPIYASSTENVLWPLLLEKGYAATQPGGYNALTTGGYAKDALHALTGAPSQLWLIPDRNQPLEVTVTDMPSMADVGGHSILGGLLTGKGLTAVEPDIQVCVSAQSQKSCTAVCKPGHECTARFPNTGKIDYMSGTLTVEVLDVPSTSERNRVAVFQKAPNKCMAGSPCQVQPLKSASVVTPGPLTISFQSEAPAHIKMGNIDGTESVVDTLPTLDAIARKLNDLTDSQGIPLQPVTLGTINKCPFFGNRCVGDTSTIFNVGSTIGGLVPGHEYYLKQFIRDSNPTKATVIVGNPWGIDVPPISLPVLQYPFFSLTTNYAKPAKAPTCSCAN
jgi:Calpain family cysteine protease